MTPSDRGSRSARWRSPRYDRYTEAAEIPLLALSVLLIPVLVLPEISKLGSAERAGLDVIGLFVMKRGGRDRHVVRAWA